MGREYINRISIKKDGVSMSTKSSNVSGPYETYKSDLFSKIYAEKGQRGLDLNISKLVLEGYVELRGNHPSLSRYQYAIEKIRDEIGTYSLDIDITEEETRILERAANYCVEYDNLEKEKEKEMGL